MTRVWERSSSSLAARDGVEAVLLLSGDGLPIEHAARGAVRCGDGGRARRHTRQARRAARRGRRPRRAGYGRARVRWRTPGARRARAPATGSRSRPRPTPTSVPCSTTCASIARRSRRCSDALGRSSGRRLGHPLLAAEHAANPEAASATLRRRLHRGGGGRAPLGVDPPRANSRRRRRGTGRPGSARCSISRAENFLVEPRAGVHRAGPHLGHVGGAPARSRRRGAVAARRLGGGRRGRRFGAPRTAALATARRHDRLVTVGVVPVAARDRLRLHRPRRAARRRRPHGGALLREAGRRHGARPDGGGRALEQRTVRLDRRPPAARGRAAHPGGGGGDAAARGRRRPRLLPRRDADLDRRRPARAQRRRCRGHRGVRVGRRRHLAGARAGPAQGPERQRDRWVRPCCWTRTTASSGPIATRSSCAGCRTWWSFRPTAGSWSCPPSGRPP